MKTLILTLILFAQFAQAESDFSRRERERYNDEIAAQNAAPMERRQPQVIYQTPAPQLYVPKIRCVRDALYEDVITCTQE